MNTSDSPATPDEANPPSARQFNTRAGLVLFAIYLALYAGFVLINAFSADTMEEVVLVGLNLAIVYGFGLIAVAVILALVYGMVCKAERVEECSGDRVDSEEQQ